MPTVYIEARPKGRNGPVLDYVVEDRAFQVLAKFRTQREAVDWAKAQGMKPLIARVRYRNERNVPEHWRPCR